MKHKVFRAKMAEKLTAVRKQSVRLAVSLWMLYCISAQTPLKNVLPPSSASHISIVATVKRVKPGIIDVISAGKPLVVTIGPESVVWTGSRTRGLSAIHPGDEIWVSGRIGTDNEVVASQIYQNPVHITGDILGLDDSHLTVETLPVEKRPRMTWEVQVAPATEFSDSQRSDLKVGRRIDVVGVKIKYNTIEASKIIVYIDNRPAQFTPETPVVRPNF